MYVQVPIIQIMLGQLGIVNSTTAVRGADVCVC
jgi:Sec-independent protein secretion pathway component TatC